MKRRYFLECAAAGVSATACRGPASPWRFFTPAEAATMDALADALIPPDQDPGGKDAGVTHFIDRQLTRKYKRFQPMYRERLAALGNFSSLDANRQSAMLEEWEKGPQRESFGIILSHAMQGYYGSPRHGGNRDAVSWRMLGVPTVPVRGRLHYALPPSPSAKGA